MPQWGICGADAQGWQNRKKTNTKQLLQPICYAWQEVLCNVQGCDGLTLIGQQCIAEVR